MDLNKVAIIILNWNGLSDTLNCLKSIKKYTTYKNYQITVVDNNSKNNEAQIIKRRFPHIEVIKNPENYGFARGNNIGIKRALENEKVKYILTLNNDTEVTDGWLSYLVKTMEKNDNLGSAQPKLVFFENPQIINNAGINIYKDGSGLNRKIYQKDNIKKNCEIFGSCAACAIYRRKALSEVGLFDEDFFCYMEDVDLAWRLRLHNWKSILVAAVKIKHKHSASSKKIGSYKEYLINRNTLYTLFKNYPLKYIVLAPIYKIKLFYFFFSGKKRKHSVKRVNKLVLFTTLIKATLNFSLSLPELITKRSKIKRNQKANIEDIDRWLFRFSPMKEIS